MGPIAAGNRAGCLAQHAGGCQLQQLLASGCLLQLPILRQGAGDGRGQWAVLALYRV
jgi:hypothetical protein